MITMSKARDFNLEKEGKTFDQMAILQKKEANNHSKLIDTLLDEAKKRKNEDEEWAMICCLEALRNIEHRKLHLVMNKIYKELL